MAEAPPGLFIPQERQVVTQADIRGAGRQDWHLNNTALKSIRDTHERPLGVPCVEKIDLFDCEDYPILTLVRGAGEAYTLKEPCTPWS